MGEIKSSWEIAMEKVEKLKELTPEELKKQEEERYTLVGRALADKYLRVLTLRQLEIELGKYSEKERVLLGSIVASSLYSAIELGNYERLEKVVRGISYLEQKELPGEAIEDIKELFREYHEVRKEIREEMAGSAGEILLQLGISGSAIREVNAEIVGESQKLPDRIVQSFHDRLERLKQKLFTPSAE